MRCSACGFSAPTEASFCPRCGAKLSLHCQSCGFRSPLGSHFCGGCGASLIEASETAVTGASGGFAPVRDQRPERRQVTILFVDMIGSTEMSVRLDEEDFKDVIYCYRDICASAVRQFDGCIVRYIGDGILICFGFPFAHEDDPIRATRAGLALLDNLQRFNAEEEMKAIHVRMGMHTGIVIAGDLRSSDSFEAMGILGETPNIASRVQSLAAPDRLVITNQTAQLLGERFDLIDLGLQQVRGVDELLHLFEVSGERTEAVRERPAASHKMIGRQQELALLQDRFFRAQDGEGQVVQITAEAGAGKTRLVREFKARLEPAAFLPMTCYCSAYSRSSAFYPIIEMIRRVVRPDGEADADELAANLQRAFVGLQTITPEAAALVAELLELPVSAAIKDIPPARRRELLLEVLTQWVLRQSEDVPVVLVIEDLHWADASTTTLLRHIVERLSNWRVMAIFTFRPELTAEWLLGPQVTRLGLRRLSKNEARALTAQIAETSTVPEDIIASIVAKTGGIPLFIEELTKAVLAGASSADHDPVRLTALVDSIPSTLRGSLAARLDRLQIAKPLAQVAATLGLTFDSEVLAAVTGESQPALRAQLDELLRQGFIHQHGTQVQAKYSFKHALIQEAAYDSLLKSERRSMHRRIAEVISTQFADVVAATPEVLAEHYAAADLAEAAIAHWEAAGNKAAERSANVEAASHFANALAILRRLPDTAERARRELSLELERGSQLLAIKGNAAPQVEEVFTRAYQLSWRLGEHRLLFRALYGLMMFFIVRGQLEKAHQCGVRLIEQADRAGDDGLQLQAKRPLGLTQFYLGQFSSAKETLKQALRLYDPDRHHHHRFEYGSDPAVLAQCNLAWTEWFVGLPDTAVADSAEAMARAIQLNHPHSLGFALSFEASIRQSRGEPNEALQAAEQAIQIGQSYRFPYWSAWGRILRGWAIGRLVRPAAGVVEIKAGLDDYRATGAELIRPYGLMLLAETLGAEGAVEDALTLLNEAIDITEANRTLFCGPELYRLRGSLLLAADPQDDAGGHDLEKAADLAHALGSPMLELRALVSLVSASPHRDSSAPLGRLERLRAAMTEGFATTDLTEAARVIDLAATHRR